MRQVLVAVALLALAACDGNGVMDQIREGEAEDASTLQEEIESLGVAVTEAPQTLPSGLELQFVRRGNNQSLAQPTRAANVLVHYAGSLVEGGEEFDSSFARGEPAEFPLAGVVPGFAEAITQMRPGDEVIATFPGSLGYGEAGQGPIPPNAALRFRIVLLAFQEPGGQVVQAR
ncbi:MAG: FKBP-type peptidyl-prolyl cis-trans isomerase [Hyphomonadaceae bacterium]|nr:FKBP-type peptidyl-prolyl cis-trans isomerase [Hyphomonadaceae bacterium]